MHILLTNDDGIDAPGLAALERVARTLGEVTVVAPADHQSGCSHAVTTETPLELRELGPRRFALAGTPVDCVRVALLHLAADVDLVLAGINDGGNLGVDILMSGTVAAAREATILGWPAIAVSQYRLSGRMTEWDRSARLAAVGLEHVLAESTQPPHYWNINLPHLDDDDRIPAVVRCQPDRQPLPIRYEEIRGALRYCGDYHNRPRLTGSDVDVCFAGQIAVSRLTYDLGVRLRGDAS